MYDFIEAQLNSTKLFIYDETHNLTLAIKTIINFVKTNTIFELNRIIRKNDNNKFLQLLQDSDNDGYFNLADEFKR